MKQQGTAAVAMISVLRRFCCGLGPSLLGLLCLLAFHASDARADVARFSPYGGDTAAAGRLTYVEPGAPRGGTLRLASTLTYDTTNMMRFPGRPPNELRYVFDSLLLRVENEDATYFGLLADTVEVSEDFSVVRFGIDPRARWHDGTEVTAEDVAFTFRTVAEHGLPFHRRTLSAIDIKVLDPRTVEFRNSETGSWRYIDMIGRFPIQSQAFWAGRDVSRLTLDIPMGSGPYLITELDTGRVELERSRDYWAAAHPLSCGRWNFDRITMERYLDKAAMTEAMKRRDLDLLFESDARNWLSGYDGPALRSGDIERMTFLSHDAGATRGLVMNTRRKPLDDIRVRTALILAFDMPWIIEMQGGVDSASESFYGQTEYAAEGPAGPRERALLAPLAAGLPGGILDAPGPDLPGASRQRLRQASALLDAAGYPIEGRWRRDPDTGTPLTLVYVTAHPSTLAFVEPYRQWLERLGIVLEVRVTDLVMGRRLILEHDYDLTWLTWIPTVPPGELERIYWHSEQAAGDGYALAGASDPAIDAMIDRMQRSLDIEETKAAARALDRLLRWGRYFIPVGHRDEVWFVADNDLAYPEPRQIRPNPVHHWWWKDASRSVRQGAADTELWPSC